MIKDIKKTYDSYQNSMINKVNKFQQSVIKNNKFNDSYELNNLIIHRQLLIKTFEEINKELKKITDDLELILMKMLTNILMN